MPVFALPGDIIVEQGHPIVYAACRTRLSISRAVGVAGSRCTAGLGKWLASNVIGFSRMSYEGLRSGLRL